MYFRPEKNQKGEDIINYEILQSEHGEFYRLKDLIDEGLKGTELHGSFERLFSILRLKTPSDEVGDYWEEFALDVIEIVSYLKRTRTFYFDDGKEGKYPMNETASLSLLVSKGMRYGKSMLYENPAVARYDLIECIYQKMLDYCFMHKDYLRSIKWFSNYKLTVITGLILFKLKPDALEKFSEFTLDPKFSKPFDMKEIVISHTRRFSVSDFDK